MRKLASIVVCAGLLVSISACSTPASSLAICDEPGNAPLVATAGEFGADPETEFPTPLISNTLGVAETIKGEGDHVPVGGVVVSTVFVLDGETGAVLIGGDRPLILPTDGFAYPFTQVLQCGSVGSRIVATGSAIDLFGGRSSQLQIADDASLVLVADISLSFLGRANGVDQLSPNGMPSVVLAPNGQPGFTFSDSPAPTEFRAEVLKQGTGAKVADDDVVLVHFSSVIWNGDALVDTTWGAGPELVQIGASDEGVSLPADVSTSLVGHTVGSQLIIAVPGDQTVVYVVDILGIAE